MVQNSSSGNSYMIRLFACWFFLTSAATSKTSVLTEIIQFASATD